MNSRGSETAMSGVVLDSVLKSLLVANYNLCCEVGGMWSLQ